jgi:excisionase family DNA binding protein
MRSLDEFYKYIEKQEQALREQNARRTPEPAPRAAAPPPEPVVTSAAATAPPPAPEAEPLAPAASVTAEPVAATDEEPEQATPQSAAPEPGAPPAETEALPPAFVPPPLPPRTPRPSRYESILPPEVLRPGGASPGAQPGAVRGGQNGAPRKNGHHEPVIVPPPTSSDIRYLMRGGVTVPVKPGSKSAPAGTDELPDIEAYIPMLRDPASEDPRAEDEEDEEGRDEIVAVGSEALPEEPRIPVSNEEAAALWGRLPRHIQLLFSLADDGEEVAQKYYTRGFKESRRELIERLLNPTLTLEEAARVLGVCPTTVRRYTNRGVLPHHRTVGQQRRFRLSDVLAYLERSADGRSGAAEEESDEEYGGETAP